MITILCGDALEKLCELPDESVQCCVTSPPFLGLRDYGTATWDGGEADCPHVIDPVKAHKQFAAASTLNGSTTRQENHGSTRSSKSKCVLCGAKRIDAQLGLEKTPEEYVAKMVEVFREVRRVLRNDGTLWLNLGDSYSSGGRGSYDSTLVSKTSGVQNNSAGGQRHTPEWAKPKDLIGIPWMVAFALRADGWWLRSDIIWAKPNPMPESVTDRPTKSHEYIFLLTKSARYFYDADAIKEQSDYAGYRGSAGIKSGANGDRNDGGRCNIEGESCRNKRSVWTVTTQPYPEAHFATYPPDLIKPCIMAGSKVGDTVLDPFAGSGTTGLVALELGRKAILIELNPKYVALIEQRTNVTPGLPLS